MEQVTNFMNIIASIYRSSILFSKILPFGTCFSRNINFSHFSLHNFQINSLYLGSNCLSFYVHVPPSLFKRIKQQLCRIKLDNVSFFLYFLNIYELIESLKQEKHSRTRQIHISLYIYIYTHQGNRNQEIRLRLQPEEVELKSLQSSIAF